MQQCNTGNGGSCLPLPSTPCRLHFFCGRTTGTCARVRACVRASLTCVHRRPALRSQSASQPAKLAVVTHNVPCSPRHDRFTTVIGGVILLGLVLYAYSVQQERSEFVLLYLVLLLVNFTKNALILSFLKPELDDGVNDTIEWVTFVFLILD